MSRRLFALFFLIVLAGCGDGAGDATPSPTATPEPPPLAPPAAGEGFQLRGGDLLLLPGAEVSWCTYVNGALDSVAAVHAIRAQLGPYGQHVAIYQSADTYPDGGGPCDSRDLGLATWSFVAGSFEGGGLQSYPDGTAMALHPDKTLVINSHYVNTGDEAIGVHDLINLYTLPIDDVRHWLGSWQLVNFDVAVPPGEGYASDASCVVPFDMNIVLQMGHTEAAGVSVRIELFPEGSDTAQVLYDGPPMVDDPTGVGTVRYFEAPLAVSEGDRIAWSCTWQNDGDTPLSWPDEMCTVLITYHPDVGVPIQCPRNMWALEAAP